MPSPSGFYFFNKKAGKFLLAIFFHIILILHSSKIHSQLSNRIDSINIKLTEYNDAQEYEKSIQLLTDFLTDKKTTSFEKCKAYLFKSYTYKRLFNYEEALYNLDLALQEGIKSPQKAFIENNIKAEKAFIHFDIHNYHKAAILMKELADNHYKYIDTETKVFIIMQEGYLLMQQKKYSEAEKKLDESLELTLKTEPRNAPNIYGKKIELYNSMKLYDKKMDAFQKGMFYAKKYGVIKYEMYLYEVMQNQYKINNDYKNAFEYRQKFDSLIELYNANNNLGKIQILERKIEERQKILEMKKEKNEKMLLVFLIIFLVLISFLYFTINKRLQAKATIKLQEQYTYNLLQNTEIERKRIASDLHDSVNQELVLLKNDTQSNIQETHVKIDSLIEHVRIISRNLHHVLFETIGLKDSIIDLLQRVQAIHKDILFSYDIKYNKFLAPADEIQIYRTLQEAINNAIKYANAQALMIKIEETNQLLLIEIKDSGKGFDVEKKLKDKNSFGLLNIVNRIKAIGGQIKFSSNDKGTTIYITITKPKIKK